MADLRQDEVPPGDSLGTHCGAVEVFHLGLSGQAIQTHREGDFSSHNIIGVATIWNDHTHSKVSHIFAQVSEELTSVACCSPILSSWPPTAPHQLQVT